MYSMTVHLSPPWAFGYKCFVTSNWYRPALLIFRPKLGLFCQIRFQAPFRRYAKVLLQRPAFLYVWHKKCTRNPLLITLESNVSKICTPKYLFSLCTSSILLRGQNFLEFGPRPLFQNTLKSHCTDRLFCTSDTRNALYIHSRSLWNQTFWNSVHPNTCSQWPAAVFCLVGQCRTQFFKTFGHKCVKQLNI